VQARKARIHPLDIDRDLGLVATLVAPASGLRARSWKHQLLLRHERDTGRNDARRHPAVSSAPST
jgi:hypothetical protein